MDQNPITAVSRPLYDEMFSLFEINLRIIAQKGVSVQEKKSTLAL